MIRHDDGEFVLDMPQRRGVQKTGGVDADRFSRGHGVSLIGAERNRAGPIPPTAIILQIYCNYQLTFHRKICEFFPWVGDADRFQGPLLVEVKRS